MTLPGYLQAAPPPPPVTIDDCIALTLKENRTIKNAYLDRVSQKYALRMAEEKFIPTLSIIPKIDSSGNTLPLGVLSSNTTGTSSQSKASAKPRADLTLTELLPTGGTIKYNEYSQLGITEQASPTRNYGWGVSLTQPLLKGGGVDVTMASVRQARLTEQGNILSLKSTIMDTLNSVVKSYRDYVQAIKTLEIAKTSLQRSKELIDTNRELIAAGRMAANDIVESEADMANKEFSLLSAENDVDAKRLALTKAIDIDKNTRIAPVTHAPPITDVPYTFDQAKKLAFENRPDYQKSLLQYQSDKIGLMVAKNNTLWDLSLTGGYGEDYSRYASPSSNSSTGGWTAGLILTIQLDNIYRASSDRYAYIAADIGLKKSENDLAKQRESIEIEVQDALRNAEMKYRQIRLATQSRVLSEKKVDIETEKLKVGLSTNFKLVSYQNDLITSQNNELGAVINYLNSLTDLDRSLGITLEKFGVSLVERK